MATDTIHDRAKAYARNYQRISVTADKSVDTDKAYDEALARNKAWAEAEFAAEGRGADIDEQALPVPQFMRRQAGGV